jgi:hypothetical protein
MPRHTVNEQKLTYQVSTSARGDPNIDAAVRESGSGLGADCVIARVGQRGSIGDIGELVSPVLGSAGA